MYNPTIFLIWIAFSFDVGKWETLDKASDLDDLHLSRASFMLISTLTVRLEDPVQEQWCCL